MTSALRRALEPVARPARRLLDPAVGTLSHLLRGRPPGQPVPVRPCAEPYEGGSGPVGVLVCHGYTGSPWSVRPWAQHLESAGFRVVVPRLPGHGTSWQELNATAWTDWYTTVERAFLALRQECQQVFVAGLSMGGCLGLRLAQQHGPAVTGLVLVNPCISITHWLLPALPLLQAVVPSLDGITNDIAKPGVDECGYDRNPLRAMYSQTFLWADVRENLDRVGQPLLVFRSRVDHVTDSSSVNLIKQRALSVDQTYVMLDRSYHVATLDYDAETIFERTVDFVRRVVKED